MLLEQAIDRSLRDKIVFRVCEACRKFPCPPSPFLLNLLWIVLGGLWMAVGRVIAAIVMAITIIGLPWTRAAFNIAAYTLLRISAPDRLALSAISCGLCSPRRLVASTRPSYHSTYPCLHNHRHSFCLGACEAGRTGFLANRQDNCTGRGRAIPVRGSGLKRIIPIGALPVGHQIRTY